MWKCVLNLNWMRFPSALRVTFWITDVQLDDKMPLNGIAAVIIQPIEMSIEGSQHPALERSRSSLGNAQRCQQRALVERSSSGAFNGENPAAQRGAPLSSPPGGRLVWLLRSAQLYQGH